ncbi:4-hydroxybenzoate octaprenyltransferase [Candidatus Sororendozoicomonas aggregata]|uniref:4-hydroxybenzoate octaprenyltransferase n=1 Tax=Candidatus Sororendozoicomonas aggregata TaxID=3073239 RepID=UPI003B75CFA6
MNTTVLKDFIALTRLDRPIGIYLLLWPTLWSLWLSAGGVPHLHNLVVFVSGVILMRCAGCVINDYADRHVDGFVKRTADRPLATGRISEKQALAYFAALVFPAFLLVLTTNPLTIGLSLIGLLLATIYPFAKRYTHLPQVVLGAAFGWSVPMAYAAESGSLVMETWLLFVANLLWTVAYDTQYAMVDRDDDVSIGIKSTAILLGKWDTRVIALLQGMFLLVLIVLGVKLTLGLFYYLALVAASALFFYQQSITARRERDACFKAFLNNHWIGAIIFLGIVLGV